MNFDRQFRRGGCRAPMMAPALFIGIFLFGRLVYAQSLGLGVSQSSTEAPTLVTLTASVADEKDILSYGWGVLDTVPRCRFESCEVAVAIASCRQVELTVVDQIGRTDSVREVLCVDGAGQPPVAELIIKGSGPYEIELVATPGSDPIFDRKLWIDDRLIDDVRFSLDTDGNCHAIDALVADRRGRIGVDRRTLCTSDSAPDLWLGSEQSCPTKEAPLIVCSEASHPLGLSLEMVQGDIPANDCATLQTEGGLERKVMRVQDEQGRSATASLFTCTATTSTPTLLFMKAIEPVRAFPGQELVVQVELAGGRSPYSFEATLSAVNNVGQTPLQLSSFEVFGEELAQLRFEAPPLGIINWEFEGQVLDARGRRAQAKATVLIGPPDAGIPGSDMGRPDTGFNDMGEPLDLGLNDFGAANPPRDSGMAPSNVEFTACTTTAAGKGELGLFFWLGLVLLFRERRSR